MFLFWGISNVYLEFLRECSFKICLIVWMFYNAIILSKCQSGLLDVADQNFGVDWREPDLSQSSTAVRGQVDF